MSNKYLVEFGIDVDDAGASLSISFQGKDARNPTERDQDRS